MDWLIRPETLIALATLTSLEIVLGIDNIIFISILSGKLPEAQQPKTRMIGLAMAMLMRIALLFSITWVMGLTKPILDVLHYSFSGRDLILIIGGLFLLVKSTHEIHDKLEGAGEHAHGVSRKKVSMLSIIIQIMLLDIVFSLDSVITAVGMSNEIAVMVTAVIVAVGFMMVFSGSISTFVHNHPTVKILALSFLLLIGVNLIADGFHHHIPKGYTYFAMAFSVFIEMINLKIHSKQTKPIVLRERQL